MNTTAAKKTKTTAFPNPVGRLTKISFFFFFFSKTYFRAFFWRSMRVLNPKHSKLYWVQRPYYPPCLLLKFTLVTRAVVLGLFELKCDWLRISTSQKSFSGSDSQTLFSAEPGDSRKYVCFRRLIDHRPTGQLPANWLTDWLSEWFFPQLTTKTSPATLSRV